MEPTALRAVPDRSLKRTMFVAGLLQLAATFTPAVRVSLVGTTAFIHLGSAGVAFVALAAATLVVAVMRAGWWRWLPGPITVLLLAAAYWKIVHAPSGRFVDPLLRHAVHPAWGFVPMFLAALVSVIGAAVAGFSETAARAPLPLPSSVRG